MQNLKQKRLWGITPTYLRAVIPVQKSPRLSSDFLKTEIFLGLNTGSPAPTEVGQASQNLICKGKPLFIVSECSNGNGNRAATYILRGQGNQAKEKQKPETIYLT